MIHTKQNFKKSSIALALTLIMIIACLTTACQQTPEELIVQSKAENELMDKINSNDENVSNVQPQTNSTTGIAEYISVDQLDFSDELVTGLTLNTNADVCMPSVDNYPIIKFRRKQFFDEDLNNVLDTLLESKTLYETRDSHVMSKAEIEQQMLETKLEYKDLDSPTAKNKGITSLEELHKQRDAILENLNNEMKTAPETIPLVEHDRSLFEDNLRGTVYENNSKLMDIAITNNSSDANLLGVSLSRVSDARVYIGDPYMCDIHKAISGKGILPDGLELISIKNMPESIKMNPEEAIELAEATFVNMGAGEDVKVSEINYIDIPLKGVSCYAIKLVRYVNGVPMIPMDTDPQGATKRTDDKNNDPFSVPIPYETMSVLINDDGIIDLLWKDPIECVETVNQNVELISKEKIVDVFRQEFKNAFSTKELADVTSTYDCYNVALTYGLAKVPNDNNTFMSIPLWDFYAKWEISCDDGYKETNDASIITINAIDNSRFIRQWGY